MTGGNVFGDGVHESITYLYSNLEGNLSDVAERRIESSLC